MADDVRKAIAELGLPARQLFRFTVLCRRKSPLWSSSGAQLDESYRLPDLPSFDHGRSGLDVRAAWSEEGLAFVFELRRSEATRSAPASGASDGPRVQIYIDTRDVRNVHRAGRFCHRFDFRMRRVASGRLVPTAAWMPVPNAKALPGAVPADALEAIAKPLEDGWSLEAFVSRSALTGYDPNEFSRIGLQYVVYDPSLGTRVFSSGNPLPYDSDPSLWAAADLVY
ncbi:hypothetical protein [Thermopirellula anaerolimosa]